MGLHVEGVTENADVLGPIADFPAECAFGAIADEEDGGSVIFNVVSQVVEDAACLAHAGGRDDDGFAFDVVERL